MEIDRYYIIYSTMTLAIGSLIALVGIFIIFRIQLQRDRIRQGYMDMQKLLNLEPEVASWKDINQGLRQTLETKEEAKSNIHRAVEHKHNRVKKSENILHYTISRGVFILSAIGVLFILHVFVLYFHNEMNFMKMHRHMVFLAMFLLDALIIATLLKYLITCILPKGDEYFY